MEPWHPWFEALNSYRYAVDLGRFRDRQQYPDWFTKNILIGNRNETIAFEDSFRKNAPHHLGAWFEVVFWKVPNPHKERITNQVINRTKTMGVSAQALWEKCALYIDEPSKRRFVSFQRCLVAGSSIAVCATFPAFIAPKRFPMVDTRVAKWVRDQCLNNSREQGEPVLIPPQHFGTSRYANVLTIADYAFMERWTEWCRAMAQRLTSCSGVMWRPRDVEMAVFEAWGEKTVRQHPHRHLPLLK